MENFTFLFFRLIWKPFLIPARYSLPKPFDAKQDFCPESDKQKWKVQNDLKERHVLVNKVNIISG